MTATAAKILDASAARIEMEVPIDAPVAEVWKALIEEPDAWWVSEVRVVPGGSKFVFDARAGGTLVEQNDAGAGVLWFTVIQIEPGRTLNLSGCLAPPWGGPNGTFLLIELEERGGGTLVKMTNSMHGHVAESALPEMESGWRLLFENGLKQFVETGQRA